MKKLTRQRLYLIIFESNTKAGRRFDVFLLWAILSSVLFLIIETIQSVQTDYRIFIQIGEWFFTFIFTIEYFARIYASPKRWRYVLSFWGLVDLVAILPSFLGLFIPATRYFTVVRSIRLLRVFKILRLTAYTEGASIITGALFASRHKITVFLGAVVTIVLIMGTTMYIIEGPEHGFADIPTSIYWAIVTMTTVGFGDITPGTGIGKMLASILMIIGYGVIAVPTGIVTSEMIRGSSNAKGSLKNCVNCPQLSHELDAFYCRSCGAQLSKI
jgi:voltage-gated potassium channel